MNFIRKLCYVCVLYVGGVCKLDSRDNRVSGAKEQIWWNIQQGCAKKVHNVPAIMFLKTLHTFIYLIALYLLLNLSGIGWLIYFV